jgi:hypothetical protein
VAIVVRRFSADRLYICKDWFDRVETSEQWKDHGPIGGSESQPTKVELIGASGFFAIAKPGPTAGSKDSVYRAANEKIAFDLAHLLELPIPPVILWYPDAVEFPTGRCISAWAFAQSDSWDSANSKGVLTKVLIDSAGPPVSAMRVFHTWISDIDRKSEHTQVDLQSHAELSIAFIDHAFSLSQVWQKENASVGACPAYMPAPEIKDVMIEMADRIAGLDDEKVKEAIARIPSIYLPDLPRKLIISNLLSRKGNLRILLSL